MKLGDFVRTKDGLIMKIEKIERNVITTDISLNDYSSNLINRRYLEDFIIKSSPNIIDLIEVGDYVNGYKVEEVLKDSVGYRGTDDYIYDCGEVKSILTKEQFESMEYRIGE